MSATSASLCRILDQWSMDGGSLDALLREYSTFHIQTEGEVQAICRALDRVHKLPVEELGESPTPIALLSRFFSAAETDDAKVAVVQEGLTVLRWFVADAVAGKHYPEADILAILRLFAVCKQKEDVQWIYKALMRQIAPNHAHWFQVFEPFRSGHPYAKPFIQGVAKHLPKSVACLAFLELCDVAYESGLVTPHAFESEEGLQKLKKYLQPSPSRSREFARAAARTMKNLRNDYREELQAIAAEHPDPIVSLQSSIDRAAMGNTSEITKLQEQCSDWRYSFLVQKCLEASSMESLIPTEARAPDFLVKAELSFWLTVESEYRVPPDSMEIVDQRSLFWPPVHQTKLLHLVRYHYNAPKEGLPSDGIGIVGSQVASLVHETNPSMPFEDLYGLYCCWEMEFVGDPLAPRNRTAKAGRNLLRRNNPGF